MLWRVLWERLVDEIRVAEVGVGGGVKPFANIIVELYRVSIFVVTPVMLITPILFYLAPIALIINFLPGQVLHLLTHPL